MITFWVWEERSSSPERTRMFTSTHSATKHADGTMTTGSFGNVYKGYGSDAPGANDSIDGGFKIVAVTWTDRVEYLYSDFEGPPAMERSYHFEAESYVGKVVARFSENTRVMSDVWEDVPYMTVMTDDGEFKTMSLGWGNTATVDAPPSVMEAFKRDEEFKAIKAKVAAKRAAAKEAAAYAAREAATPYKGKTVKFVKGRKVPKGTVGEVIWFGEGKKYGYGYGPAPKRVGVKDAAGTVHWSAASNVAVVS